MVEPGDSWPDGLAGVDSQNARKMRDRLRNQFAESEPKELAETARELGMPLPMSAQATQLFRATAATGIDQDDLVVAKLLAKLSGVPDCA